MIATSFAWPVLEYIFFSLKGLLTQQWYSLLTTLLCWALVKKIQIHIALLEFHRGREFKSPLLSLLYTTNVGMGYPI